MISRRSHSQRNRYESNVIPHVCRRVGYLLFFIIVFAVPAVAQDLALRFKHLGIVDGLSQSSVYCLLQDKKGFIWVGTTDGLSRYDGYSFRHFKYDQGNPNSIRSNELQALGEDAAGNLLVGTSVGLDLFDPRLEKFYPIPVKGDEQGSGYVKSIFTDSRGTIWVATGRGLKRYDAVNKVLLSVEFGKDISPRTIVYTIAEDADRKLWFGVGRKVVKYDPETQQTLPLPDGLTTHKTYGQSGVYFIAHDGDRNVWIGTERDGVIELDHETGVVHTFNADTRPNPVSNDMIRAISFYKGNVWIGSRNGLYVINRQKQVINHYQVNQYDPVALSGNSILSFMHDNAGSIWVGTFAGGVSIVQPGNDNFSYINERNDKNPGLNYPVVSCILEDASKNLWIATEGGGINVYNRQTKQFSYLHVDPSSKHLVNQETIKAIQFDESGNLWIGTLEGLFYYEVDTRRIRQEVLRERTHYDEMVYTLAYNEGRLWIGTKGGLFCRTKEGQYLRYRHQPNDSTSIISNNINAMISDRDGGIWIGTETGLSWLPQGKQQFINYLTEYASVFNKNAILCIYEDQRRNCWIGTRGGGLKLFSRQQQRFFTLDKSWGLTDNIVHAIMEDRQGNIWVSFNQGIARIVLKKTNPPFTKEEIQVTNYSVNNGLGSNEFSAAAFRTSAGQIMFGGVNGIVSFQPEQMVTNKVPPPVVLTDLLIKNIPVAIDKRSPLQQSVTYTDNITLTYDQAYFTIHFAALNYINPRTNQYAYKLEGLNQDTLWHYVGNQQTATYTNLSAGKYIFKVKAANNDGYWNEHYTTLHLTVLPPIWKTWYAYLLYAFVISTVLYLFYSYSIKTTRLQQELLMQEMNRQKDQELVQRKLSFFTNISHEIKTPLTLVLAPVEKLLAMVQGKEKETAQLLLMKRNGERLLRLTDQLLDFRKFEAGSMPLQVAPGNVVAFMREIMLSYEGYARQLQIDLSMQVEQEGGEVWHDGDKLEKIVNNLLSNAFKFTPAGGAIKMTINSSARQTILRVEDTGEGIAAANLESIFNPFQHYNDTGRQLSGTGIGLAFTKGLVALHHGKIAVVSTQATPGEKGYTCFTVTLPAGQEAYAPEERQQAAKDIVPVAVMPATEEVHREKDSGEGETKPLLLIVEDNDEVRGLLIEHYSSTFTVQAAASGVQGLQIAYEVLPDIIISDVMMPGMNGTEMSRQLKQDQRTSHIPIVLLTARNQVNYQIEGYETGADEYITKPFNLALMDVRVNNLLQSRRLLRERYSRDITLQPSALAITPADEVFLDKVMHFIEENIMEPTLQVEEMGKVVNMSRTTLYRKLKALTGQSAIEFIRGVRLKRAAQLLQRKEYTVNEVAYMVGFSDVDYFRKCFKQQFGKTPREYEGR